MILTDHQADSYIKQNIKFFTANELKCKCGCNRLCIDSELLTTLENLRIKLARPIVITSAYRCEKHNREVGGVKDSEHLKGLAVDIFTDSKEMKEKIIKIVDELGVKRIGVGKNFIHIDISTVKKPKMWSY